MTGDYLKDHNLIKIKEKKRERNGEIIVKGAQENNLKNIDVEFPLGYLISVTGVSGSGKSTLINDILLKALSSYFYKTTGLPGKHKDVSGVENIDKIISIDQSPIGRTPRSNPATYILSLIHI